MRQRKRKLITIAILALALLIGGTFAYTAFNQQAINDRANAFRSHAPGRIHDYYNRDTGNKDIFAENYGHDAEGEEPIMVRIRLSEYMAIQILGEDDFIPVVEHSERDDTRTWTPYRSAQNDINVRTGDSLAFNDYINLTFGWQRAGQEAPWYMPTFNHELESLKTAAAGHARDYIQGDGAKDGETDGTTHPGDGTDSFWSESGPNSSYDNSAGTWPGAAIMQETKQHLVQERAPMTLQQWEQLNPNQRFGNFWVLDHNTGWAYWAELLEAGQATSYLLDAAVVRDEVVRRSFVNGSYYYAIHVDSQVISPLDMERFLEPEEEGAPVDTRLQALIETVAGDGNPRWNRDSDISDFNFEIMRPGRIFTMAGQQFRYLEDMGGGNHMIIRNQVIAGGINWNNITTEVNRWYTQDFLPADSVLRAQLEEYVAPVATTFTTGTLNWDAAQRPASGIVANLHTFSVPYADRTRAVPGGVRRAFNLSVADVSHLTSIGSFFGMADRWGPNNMSWWTRTPATATSAWSVWQDGMWGHGGHGNPFNSFNGGVRPALIIHQ
ncbi:hypothetical protein [Lactococcus petauri]|uniref:hypothetical protein n=1 Tax=Lactococcus petauri TaxID=1940789 RepID=UPI0020BE7297|nr:hypothetical protein [Lactococcus petauri]UQU60662.1 hypothetical protein lgb_01427 [Lactococcus petauri]